MKKQIQEVLTQLNTLSHTHKPTLQVVQRFASDNDNLIKTTNPQHHFCVFFVPVHKESRSVFLGHHIKANDWIPPGGHMEQDEQTLDTLKREFKEELDYDLESEEIMLFDMSTKDVRSSKRVCETHYDIWYLVFMDSKVDFKFDHGEFYDAKWYSFKNAPKHMHLENFREIIEKLDSIV